MITCVVSCVVCAVLTLNWISRSVREKGEAYLERVSGLKTQGNGHKIMSSEICLTHLPEASTHSWSSDATQIHSRGQGPWTQS